MIYNCFIESIQQHFESLVFFWEKKCFFQISTGIYFSSTFFYREVKGLALNLNPANKNLLHLWSDSEYEKSILEVIWIFLQNRTWKETPVSQDMGFTDLLEEVSDMSSAESLFDADA